MFDTLLAKIFVILSSQLAITWFFAVLTVNWFHRQHEKKNLGPTAVTNDAGVIDIQHEFAVFWAHLFHGRSHRSSAGTSLFCLCSILTNIKLALCLISVNENLGTKVRAITTMEPFSGVFCSASTSPSTSTNWPRQTAETICTLPWTFPFKSTWTPSTCSWNYSTRGANNPSWQLTLST